ncbi:tetratricopeptide repeat protein 21B-like [Sinocyclocheilus grahami]|uniref:tetratricopeptide repeat protein 21B-like n=1 Tax=Sinocyclocheilus grahami TaxID=75366 RepID=UPI0007ACAEAE|nr:PREDICTED: tetratricopeptide repeat protein 21B-like [Sinocyclocheilus grahami]
MSDFEGLNGLILKGWIVLTSDTEENRPQAIRYFDSGVQDAGNLFGLMGKMEFFMAKQNEQCALDIANQIIVSHPDFSPALLMKMKVFVSLRDWEQTEAVAQRVLERDGRDLKALQMMTVIAAAKDGNMELVKVRLQALMSAVEISEPCNPSLHVEITAAISRLCGHNPEILQMLTVFVRRVSSRTPVASDVICELGYLLDHQSKYKDAHKCYSTALKTEPKCTSALVGTIRCQLMCGQLEEAAQQLAFFCEVQESLGNTAEVPLLKALLGRKQGAGEETVMHLLKDATERHFSALRGLNYGVEYLQMLDLNFLLQIVCMHLESKQDFALVPGQTPPFWLKHSNMILETVIKAVPGMSVSCYYMAYIKFLLGEHRTAQHFLNLCIEKDPSVPEVHLLQARLHLSAGEHSRCLSCLESAISVSFEMCTIRCQLMCGQLEEAAQQLAFFCEVQESLGNTAEVPLLKALLGRKQGAGEETVMHLLKDATERHFSALRGLNYGVEYLQMLDLNFLLQIVCMHLESKQDFALVPGQTPPFWLKHSNMILETVIKAVPGMSVSCYYMAYIKFLLGEHRTAQHFLNLCIEKDPSVPEVHLLQARLHLSAGEHSRCLSCLESAISVSFEVRDRFQFHLLKARALLRSGDLKNAIQCLKITMSMPGVRRPSEGPQFFISPSERVSVYLELTEALRLNGEQHEATRVLQDALLRFKGTPEETRLMLANVDLALARDDVDAAVVMLQNILPTESTYIQAREKMAHIYLERKHNEKLYITCYREISEQLPGAHTRILLADAFMKIHQPEEAVKIYREVEKIAPKYTLAKKIGQALVKAHEYETAVSYYETALKTDTLDCLMSVELSELLLKLKRFEKAQQVLEKALEHEPTAALVTMMSEVTVLRVLVKVLRARNESTLDVMKRLHDLQQKVVFRAANEHPEELEDQRKSLVVICCDWAREFHLRRNLVKAKQHYTDALNHSPDNEEVIFRLAQLYYEHQKLDYCEELCLKILQLHQNHTAALILLADTLFWKNQKEEAVKIYAIIMERNPDNFHAMAKFLHILRRMGKLDDVRSVFIACEKFSPLSVREAGYSYCKGLYFWSVMLEASLLMMAQGFVQLKQIPRARNVLKRLSRMEWSDTNADDLESACLLLADMYIKTRKYTQVDKLLDSCIRHNQSCSKAYEYRGLIMESEQRHSDAALQYELAWKHSSRAHPAVGFRLAFNYLKCKNYTLAVDVCHQVLQQCPDYPEIQDELLTRAQLSLRL